MGKTATLGIYTLKRQLGKGGMGTVYLARDPTLDRHVAVKVLPAQLAADPDYVARFKREATSLAAIRHPNLMHIYGVGTDRGHHYIAMEYVRGQNVDQIVRSSGPLALPVAARIFGQVLSALDKVHASGIVHRDIKPANVLIDEDQRAILMDFGLAKPPHDHSVTTEAILIGTPEYMAPELAEGADADYRSDIYALGILLFEMLAGTVPFRAGSSYGTLRQHVEAPVPALHALRPGLPPELDAVLARALAKKPVDRYPSVRAIAADLAPIVETPELVELAAQTQTTATVPLGTVSAVSPRAPTSTAPGPLALSQAAPTATAPAPIEPGHAAAAAHRPRWLIPASVIGGLLVAAVIIAVLWPPGQRATRGSRLSTATASVRTVAAAARAATDAPPRTRPATDAPPPAPTGLPCRIVIARPGDTPLAVEGRLLAIEGEGGVVRLQTGDRIREFPYGVVLRIEPEGGR